MYSYIPLTLTFKDQVTMRTSIKRLAKRLHKIHYRKIKYNFAPEIGKQFNCHFHGYIYYPSTEIVAIQQFLSVWKRYEGFYYVSKFTDLVKWHIYCHKDYWIHQTQINNMTYHNLLSELEEHKCHLKSQGLIKFIDREYINKKRLEEKRLKDTMKMFAHIDNEKRITFD